MCVSFWSGGRHRGLGAFWLLRGLAARTWPGGSRRNAHSIPGVLFAAIGRGANVGFTIRERVEGAADGNRP